METGSFPYQNFSTQEKAETRLESLASDKFNGERACSLFLVEAYKQFFLEVQKIA
jgi:hypothetical protein